MFFLLFVYCFFQLLFVYCFFQSFFCKKKISRSLRRDEVCGPTSSPGEDVPLGGGAEDIPPSVS